MRFRRSAPPQGLLRRRALGGEALYRVVDATSALVEVEVIRAPGLARGSHVRFTADVARAMEPVSFATAGGEGRPPRVLAGAAR